MSRDNAKRIGWLVIIGVCIVYLAFRFGGCDPAHAQQTYAAGDTIKIGFAVNDTLGIRSHPSADSCIIYRWFANTRTFVAVATKAAAIRPGAEGYYWISGADDYGDHIAYWVGTVDSRTPISVYNFRIMANDIDDIATVVKDSTSATNVKITAIDNFVDQLEGYVDGVEDSTAATNVKITAIDNFVDQLEGYTDGVEDSTAATNAKLALIENLVDQLEGYTDGVEGDIADVSDSTAATNAKVTLIDNFVDQLEGYVDGVEDSATVSVRLAAIENHVDEVEGKLDAVLDSTTVSVRLAALENHVDQLEGYTDNVEANIATLQGIVQDSTAASNVKLTAIDNLVDQVEGYTDNVEGDISTLQGIVQDSTAATNVKVTAIDNFVDELETDVAGVLTMVGDSTRGAVIDLIKIDVDALGAASLTAADYDSIADNVWNADVADYDNFETTGRRLDDSLAYVITKVENLTMSLSGATEAQIDSIDVRTAQMDPKVVDVLDDTREIGGAAGASIAADLVVIDNFVDQLEGYADGVPDLEAASITLLSRTSTIVDKLPAGNLAAQTTLQDSTRAGRIDVMNTKINALTGTLAAVEDSTAATNVKVTAIDNFVDELESGLATLQTTVEDSTRGAVIDLIKIDVDALGSASLTPADFDSIADNVWNADVADYDNFETMGRRLDDTLGYVLTKVAAVKAVLGMPTATIATDVAGILTPDDIGAVADSVWSSNTTEYQSMGNVFGARLYDVPYYVWNTDRYFENTAWTFGEAINALLGGPNNRATIKADGGNDESSFLIGPQPGAFDNTYEGNLVVFKDGHNQGIVRRVASYDSISADRGTLTLVEPLPRVPEVNGELVFIADRPTSLSSTSEAQLDSVDVRTAQMDPKVVDILDDTRALIDSTTVSVRLAAIDNYVDGLEDSTAVSVRLAAIDNFVDEVESKLDDVLDSTTVSVRLAAIDNFVDELESGQATLQTTVEESAAVSVRLAAIDNYTDEVEGKLDAVLDSTTVSVRLAAIDNFVDELETDVAGVLTMVGDSTRGAVIDLIKIDVDALGGGSLTAADYDSIRDNVWNAKTAAYDDNESYGLRLADTLSWVVTRVENISAEATLTAANYDSIRDNVWNADVADYDNQGSTGRLLDELEACADSIHDAVGLLGASTGSEPVYLHFKSDADSAAIPIVGVTIRDEDTLTVLGVGTSDASGLYTWTADPDTYQVSPLKLGSFTFPNFTEIIVPVGGLTDTIFGTPFTPGAPGDVQYCRVWGYTQHVGGLVGGIKVTSRLRDTENVFAPASRSRAVLQNKISTFSSSDGDSLGYWYLDLIKQKHLNPEAYVEIKIYGTPTETRYIAVPDSSTAYYGWQDDLYE